MSKEIMQEAVWALKDLISAYPETACIETRISAQKVIAALEAELAQPEHPLDKKADNARELGLDYEPEPKSISTNDHLCAMLRLVHDVLACTALPMKRQWVSLTDEEINDFDKKLRDNGDYCSLHFAWGISAKLREKNE